MRVSLSFWQQGRAFGHRSASRPRQRHVSIRCGSVPGSDSDEGWRDGGWRDDALPLFAPRRGHDGHRGHHAENRCSRREADETILDDLAFDML